MLSSLPALDKQIVELRLREGFSTKEVAEQVGLSSAATKTRLHRVRSKLASELDVTAPVFA